MPTSTPSRYTKLLTDISRLYDNARTAQINFAWQVGKRIVEVEQNGAFRAEYGAGLIPRLSADLSKTLGQGFSERNLARMRTFYLANRILPTSAKLDFSHYAELESIKNAKLRDRLVKQAARQELGIKDLRKLVRQATGDGQAVAKALPPLKRPAGLKLNTFAKSALNVKLPDGAVLVDCGFFVNRVMTKAELAEVDLTDTPSYTYAATVDRVVDGDTLKVIIDVGFGNRVYDKLRLRGINTPELGTPEGEKAKKFVAGLLPPGSCVVLKSHKSGIDKYGRFVVDIFYRKSCENPLEVVTSGTYLNQQLLDEGFAARMDA